MKMESHSDFEVLQPNREPLRFGLISLPDIAHLNSNDFAGVMGLLDQYAPDLDYLYFVGCDENSPGFYKWWPANRIISTRVPVELMRRLADRKHKKWLPLNTQLTFCELISLVQRSEIMIADSNVPDWMFSYETPTLAVKKGLGSRQKVPNGALRQRILFPVVRPEESHEAFACILKHCERTKKSLTLFYKTLLGTMTEGESGMPRLYHPSELEIEQERLHALHEWVEAGCHSNVEISLISDLSDRPFERAVLDVVQKGDFDLLTLCPSFMGSYFWGRAAKRVMKKAPCNIWLPYPLTSTVQSSAKVGRSFTVVHPQNQQAQGQQPQDQKKDRLREVG